MPEQRLQITLLDNAVFAASSATEGGVRTLGYVPGASLLGAAAARCYKSCTDPWNLFHSGAVRFGDGLPLHSRGQVAWPAPLTWQRPKEGAWTDAAGMLCVELANAAAEQAPARGAQRKPLRGIDVTATGHVVQLKRRTNLKTAIDPAMQRASTGQLFLYESLCAGARFMATVSWDETHAALAETAIKAICASPVALGRSRSAEYGLATVQRHVGDAAWDWPRMATDTTACAFSFWCLSDLCLLDDQGQACVSPLPQYLGLPPGHLSAERSYIQTRAYSPFNAHRRAYDNERQAICRGSVLTFVFDRPQPVDSLVERIAGGVGLYREAGLGALCVDHAWQQQDRLLPGDTGVFAAAPHQEKSDSVALRLEPSASRHGTVTRSAHFIAWLEDRSKTVDTEEDRRNTAQAAYNTVQNILAEASKLSGGSGLLREPSSTQWGHLASLGKSYAGKEGLLLALTGAGAPLYGAKPPPRMNEPEDIKDARVKARSGKNREWFAASFMSTATDAAGPGPVLRNLVATTLGDWLAKEIDTWPVTQAGLRLAALAAVAQKARQRQSASSAPISTEQRHVR